ncbi:MAG TPA: hypothetical protein VNU44_14620 [Bryobacteraceae bacterium]|jgi:hypothetical protein|nr:hypothetical protein [Bryobacteraceae bacterium]
MTGDSFVKSQLALLCWRNAPAGKPFQILQCLAFIVRNRVKAGWMGGDWLSVIANDPVYSPYDVNGHHHAAQADRALLESFPDLRDEVFQKFLWEIDRIYDGSRQDAMTEGAVWWAEIERISRKWFLENIARNQEQHPRVAQVASLTLWR